MFVPTHLFHFSPNCQWSLPFLLPDRTRRPLFLVRPCPSGTWVPCDSPKPPHQDLHQKTGGIAPAKGESFRLGRRDEPSRKMAAPVGVRARREARRFPTVVRGHARVQPARCPGHAVDAGRRQPFRARTITQLDGGEEPWAENGVRRQGGYPSNARRFWCVDPLAPPSGMAGHPIFTAPGLAKIRAGPWKVFRAVATLGQIRSAFFAVAAPPSRVAGGPARHQPSWPGTDLPAPGFGAEHRGNHRGRRGPRRWKFLTVTQAPARRPNPGRSGAGAKPIDAAPGLINAGPNQLVVCPVGGEKKSKANLPPT